MQQSSSPFNDSCAVTSPGFTGGSATFEKFELLPLLTLAPSLSPPCTSVGLASDRSVVNCDRAVLPVSRNIAESMTKLTINFSKRQKFQAQTPKLTNITQFNTIVNARNHLIFAIFKRAMITAQPRNELFAIMPL